MKIIKIVLALVAVLFGLLTIFAGSRILLGADPGYTVFLPLLIFNTAMGFVYVLAGGMIFRNIKASMYLASLILTLNLFTLIGIYFLYTEGAGVAIDSLRAMSLRTIIWFILVVGLVWLGYKEKQIKKK